MKKAIKNKCHFKSKCPKNCKSGMAFTLAEVLITLTIIGVIAALTIPNLMQKWSDHADVAKVKEAYSILSNAYKLAIRENGPINEWNLGTGGDDSKSCNLASIMSPYFKYSKKRTCFRNDDVFVYKSDGYFTTLKGNAGNSGNGVMKNVMQGQILLNNGIAIGFWSKSRIFIDINGSKKPNRVGYDIFDFEVDSDIGLRPTHSSYSLASRKKYCSVVNTQNQFWDGLTCSEWVLKHGNMDYKYRDVSAEW